MGSSSSSRLFRRAGYSRPDDSANGMSGCALSGLSGRRLRHGLFMVFGREHEDGTTSRARTHGHPDLDRYPPVGPPPLLRLQGGRDARASALRADSILFESAWSHVPLTLPAHVALFTGRLGGPTPAQPGIHRAPKRGQASGIVLEEGGLRDGRSGDEPRSERRLGGDGASIAGTTTSTRIAPSRTSAASSVPEKTPSPPWKSGWTERRTAPSSRSFTSTSPTPRTSRRSPSGAGTRTRTTGRSPRRTPLPGDSSIS